MQQYQKVHIFTSSSCKSLWKMLPRVLPFWKKIHTCKKWNGGMVHYPLNRETDWFSHACCCCCCAHTPLNTLNVPSSEAIESNSVLLIHPYHPSIQWHSLRKRQPFDVHPCSQSTILLLARRQGSRVSAHISQSTAQFYTEHSAACFVGLRVCRERRTQAMRWECMVGMNQSIRARDSH